MPCLTVPMAHYQPQELMRWMQENRLVSSSELRPSLFALVDSVSLAADAGTGQRLDSLGSSEHGINLYADLIGTALIDTGPRLHEVHDEDLDVWSKVACDTTAISFLCGAISLSDLVHHLQSLREVALPDGSLALFRFQDSHVTTHLWPLLSPGQGNQILGRIGWWAAPDVCGTWSALTPAAGHHRAGALRFDRKLYEQLNEQLLVYTVAEQVREVDSALLHGLTACQNRTLLRSRLQAARDLGLTAQSDQALYVVLSMQLPAGFESDLPFSEALDRNRKGAQTFGDALDNVPASQWEPWHDKLAAD
jgi:Domain of unknown function (DUF4123)